MYTLCVILANGVRILRDVIFGSIADILVSFYHRQGAKVSLRYWS